VNLRSQQNPQPGLPLGTTVRIFGAALRDGKTKGARGCTTKTTFLKKFMNRTNTTTIPVHITPHHLRISPNLREFAHGKFAKVRRFSSDALRMDLILRRRGGIALDGRFSATARVALPGRDIHATASHDDLYTAIVMLVRRISGLSRRRKTRLAKMRTPLRRRRISPRSHDY